MTSDSAVIILSQMLIKAAAISMPILGVCLIVGLIVSLFQVATQIQEMTLTFVPKLLAAGLTLLLIGRWMILSLVQFTTDHIEKIVNL
ncbi:MULTISPECIES: flagellar biosynthetic protein FliQ [unclassified Agarivorans]|uniref:flagellar biosynthetic protein FliQ n=1 Tax=unclassified Agarivorans TaxID=2636026 RepID=UPI0026E1A397|nr:MULTISPECIES: flagellar biosynthetic protein FliQ [unclassified Agarivorans]MDO6685841.1 flagellar biosynthetic protein FliQ [Agarivorans sp. 3_MG-2023]MDO6716044.1 flagellar biosynthetic protein FliQ [Agarivorans sp. 2_MG-2023]